MDKTAAVTPRVTAAVVSAHLDRMSVPYNVIGYADWMTEYPYKPNARFRIAHTGTSILLEYSITEDSVRAVAAHDNGRVWEDSCCEFFFAPADDGLYYNIEANCAGRVLVGCGEGRAGRTHAPSTTVALIDRWSSLGDKPFEEREGVCSWRMALVIPVGVFFRHEIKSLDGMQSKANFYKCGDKLRRPHFLSWSEISTDKPDFHRPEFFGDIRFGR